MPTVSLFGVSHSFGAQRLFSSVNVTLSGKDHFALTGANGSGKSTLMRIVAGLVAPESGRVVSEKGTQIAYLPQSNAATYEKTLFEEAEMAYERFSAMEEEMHRLEARMARLEPGADGTERILSRYTQLQETLESGEYHGRKNVIEKVLAGLGFQREDNDRPAKSFSSGWQMRIALAKVLLQNADVLLLDEPTNYLDLEARNWLESFLAEYDGAVLLVSHDRYFLDMTVTKVMEIYDNRLKVFPGSFSEYEGKRQAELTDTIRRAERQQEEIDRLEAFIRRFRYNASKARLVRSRTKLLEKMVRIEIPPGIRKIHFRFPDPPHSGKLALQVADVSKSYGDAEVLSEVELELVRGEKLVIVGPNGAGKSTLMRILAGVLKPDGGSVRCGKDVAVGYFSPEYGGASEDSISVIQAVEAQAPTDLFPQLKNLLGAFLFRGDDLHKPVSVLSGGEKSRLSLIRLLLEPVNLLLLDEPTNHLDMVSKDILLDALKAYSGSLVFVSHDRYFIESLATRVLELTEGRPHLYAGDYEYYLWKKAGGAVDDPPLSGSSGRQEDKLWRERQKELQGRLRGLEREETGIVRKIEELERACRELETKMSEAYRDGEKMKELKRRKDANAAELDNLSSLWEDIGERVRRLRTELDE